MPGPRDIVVLGGYGRLGAAVVAELTETTRARAVIAGRSIQRAEELAASFGESAIGAYADASDARTLRSILTGAALVIACSGAESLAALEVALELRVPYVSAHPLLLDRRTRDSIHERAWRAGVPAVIHAGALPGLPSVLCEWLVRRLPSIHTLRIASTGPWVGTETARRDVARVRSERPLEYRERSWTRGRRLAVRVELPEPIGPRALHPARALDLDGFPEAHCVENMLYLEPDPGPLTRGLEWTLGLEPTDELGLVAEAHVDPPTGEPSLSIALFAPDAVSLAAAGIGCVARAAQSRRLHAGLLTPREALRPTQLLDALEKRGAVISTRTAA